jgi:hypothetical protein
MHQKSTLKYGDLPYAEYFLEFVGRAIDLQIRGTGISTFNASARRSSQISIV